MNNNSLSKVLIGVIVAFVVALAVLVAAVVYSMNNSGQNTTGASGETTTSREPTDEPTEEPTDEPTEEPTDDSTVGGESGDSISAIGDEGWERPDAPIVQPGPYDYTIEWETMEDPSRKYDLSNDADGRVPLGSRPGFIEATEHVQARFDYYQAMTDSGSFWTMAPDGVNVDYAYNRAFWLRMLTWSNSWGVSDFDTSILGDDYAPGMELYAATEADADAAIQEIRDYVDEIERRYWAGEPLEVTVSVEQGDGTIYYSNGTYRPWREANLEPGWEQETGAFNRTPMPI